MAFDDTSSTANAVPLPPLGKAHIDHLVEQSFRRGFAAPPPSRMEALFSRNLVRTEMVPAIEGSLV